MLQVDAVVNPTNESLTDKNPISIRLLEVAGPELKDACKTQIGSESWRHIHTHMNSYIHMCGNVHTLCIFVHCMLTNYLSLSSPHNTGCRTGEARITGGYQLPAR